LPVATLRPCIVEGCQLLTRRTRCDGHERIHQAKRNARRPQYQGTWQADSRRARKAEPWCHCTRPGHGHGPLCAVTTNLTLDHDTGTVECKRCNSAHRRDPGGRGHDGP
jgi:hypothetical protein